MMEAVKEAERAAKMGEVPIGAVIVKDGEIIGKGHNLVETQHNGTRHAEMIAIEDATQKLGYSRLYGCEMYVTCEPCTMCAGALVLSRISKVIIGTMDAKSGACGSVYNLLNERRLNHRVTVEYGIMEKECRQLLVDFFKKIRIENRRNKDEKNWSNSV